MFRTSCHNETQSANPTRAAGDERSCKPIRPRQGSRQACVCRSVRARPTFGRSIADARQPLYAARTAYRPHQATREISV